MNNKDLPVCYLCNEKIKPTQETNKDHVPPKNLFPKGSQNLITLLVHQKCNSQFGDNFDEKFRAYILSIVGRSTNVSKELWENKVLKSFQGEHGAKKKKSIQNKLKEKTIGDDGTEINEPHLLVPSDEIDSQIHRIVKGLYYHKYKKTLPTDIQITYHPKDIKSFNEFLENLLNENPNITLQEVHKDVFKYLIATFTHSEIEGLCLLVFYNQIPFVCFFGKDSAK